MNSMKLSNSPCFGTNYKQFTCLIKKEGCYFIQEGKGSHMKWIGPSGDMSIIPNHGHKDLGVGLMDSICKQLKVANPFKTSKVSFPQYS